MRSAGPWEREDPGAGNAGSQTLEPRVEPPGDRVRSGK